MDIKYYENGAVHNDHSRNVSITVGSNAGAADLIRKIMEDDAEDAEVVPAPGDTEDIIQKILPIFYNDELEARLFLTKIRGMKGPQITELVRELRAEKKLSEMSCHRELWRALHDAGFYSGTESNWNKQLNM